VARRGTRGQQRPSELARSPPRACPILHPCARVPLPFSSPSPATVVARPTTPTPQRGPPPGAAAPAGAGGPGGGGPGGKPAPGTVITSTGAVMGAKVGTTWAFKGVPYAAPPTGDLRWKRPEAHACWDDARTALDFGSACLQADDDGNVVGAEDCLFLNVWT